MFSGYNFYIINIALILVLNNTTHSFNKYLLVTRQGASTQGNNVEEIERFGEALGRIEAREN